MPDQARTVAAILAADVVDYSRLMAADEPGTLSALKVRRAIFERLVKDFDGREFGSVGDSLMAQFPSAVNAVRCAQTIQRAVAAENARLTAEWRMSLRIGLNLGDVIEERGTLFGDGVNVAARLQALAAPDGILISGAVFEQVRDKLPATLRFAGTRQVKNIPQPVATYEVLDTDDSRSPTRALDRWRIAGLAVLFVLAASALWHWRGDLGLSPQKPAAPGAASVAVLPFVNMSTEPDNEPFADGLSEEVLNVLAKIEGLKVAGRTSSFYYKGKNEKADVIARTLGVDHLLEGSVRWSGSKVRITAQLIDARDGFHRWSQTFDREITDVFAVQEDIARSVAAALEVKLLPEDEERLAKRGTHDAQAHQLYLVGRGRLLQRDLASLRAAKALFETAIERDASYANAHSGLADAYYLMVSNHTQELDRGEQLGEQAAKRAIELDPTSSEAHASRANFAYLRYWKHGERGELERAAEDYRRALELDPSNAQARHWYGIVLAESEDVDGALEQYERAVELDPLMHQARLTMSSAFTYRGQFDAARAQIMQVVSQYPDYANAYFSLAELDWIMGRLTDARSAFARAYELSPDPNIAVFGWTLSYELDDRASGAEWLGKVTGNAYFDGGRQAGVLSLERRYAEAFVAYTRLLEQGIEDEWLALVAARLGLLTDRADWAAAILSKRHPEFEQPEMRVIFNNSEAAAVLAASWQRIGRRADAGRLLRAVTTWLDSPNSPRWPQTDIARAQVHALLGERAQALDALDRAFDAGHRGALTRVYLAFPIRSEDNPLLESVRNDPRYRAWHARIHADNARQLAGSSRAAAAASN